MKKQAIFCILVLTASGSWLDLTVSSMNKRRMKFTLAMAGFLLMAVGSGGHPSTAAATWRISQFENVLGTSLELKFAVASDNEAARAETAALAEIE